MQISYFNLEIASSTKNGRTGILKPAQLLNVELDVEKRL
jgi:hypothetical protein